MMPDLFDLDDPPEPEAVTSVPPRVPTRPLVRVWSRSRRASICRACDAPLTFAQIVASGKWMPFDADPVALLTSLDPQTHNLIEHLDSADVHFRSCPHAKEFRR